MNLILKDLIEMYCVVYIYDILVFRKNTCDHDKNPTEVLQRLNSYDLEENLDKRIERKNSINFLENDISYNMIKPTLERAQGIMDYKAPGTKKNCSDFWV
ncbi:Retrovirus-related Pol polyprotein from transposon 17.6 [Dictyocoela roeselum]|nr:Retrovirus-related Pol polyprotein from transposon 17.6 [Dictyocoela roeselum]